MKSKAVASILRHVASKVPSVSGSTAADGDGSARKEINTAATGGDHDTPAGGNEEEKLEQLYEQIAWSLGKKYGHPYDAFKLALTYVRFGFFFSPDLT